MGIIDLGGAEVFYYEEGRGRLALFLHGGPLDHRVFLHQIRELAPIRRCVAPDLRGFGRSSGTGAEKVDVEAHAHDMAAVLAHFGGVSADLVGLSFGGHVALALAQRRPDLVRSLSLVSTSVLAPSPQRQALLMGMSEVLLSEGRFRLGARLAAHMLAGGGTPMARAEVMTMVEATPYESILAMYEWIALRGDEVEKLRNIRVPTLVIAGGVDPAVPTEALALMASALPFGRRACIAGAGHLVPIEEPLRLSATLRECWGEVGVGEFRPDSELR